MMKSPWLKIPLADYEAHMAASNVDQAKPLAAIFSAQLRRFQPESVAVIGCAGGNGFEHIDPQTTTRVVGVDINPEYLKVTARRHATCSRNLTVCTADIAGEELRIEAVDLCYAALVFEYVTVGAAIRNLSALCRPSGHLVTVLQLPSASLAAITPTAIPSVARLAAVMSFVVPSQLVALARGAGFALLESTQISSGAGKDFAVQIYQREQPP